MYAIGTLLHTLLFHQVERSENAQRNPTTFILPINLLQHILLCTSPRLDWTPTIMESGQHPPPPPPHTHTSGPMLLFEKADDGGTKAGRQFYACSACRDRKQCAFFLWRDERLPAEKIRQWRERARRPSAADHRKRYDRLVGATGVGVGW